MIEKQNILALGVGDPAIACTGDTAISLVNVANRIGLRNRAVVIGRAVIDQDDFNPRVGLLQNAFDGLTQKRAEL